MEKSLGRCFCRPWQGLHLKGMLGVLPVPGIPGPTSPAGVHMPHTLTHGGFRAGVPLALREAR